MISTPQLMELTRRLGERVSEVEKKVSNVEERVNKLASVNSKCLNQLKQQRLKIDELDNKSRRNNLSLWLA